jgi:hypothetical protein
MTRGEQALAAVLKRAAADMKADLLQRLERGKITPRSLESQSRSKFRRRGKAMDAAMERAMVIAEEGQRQATSEVEAQLPDDGGDALAAHMALGDGDVAGTPMVESAVAAAADTIESAVTVSVDKVWNRILGEFLGEYERLSRQGLSDEELYRRLDAFINNLSERPIEDWARQTATVANNQGRDIVSRTAAVAEMAQYVVRSEVLDENTCANCRMLDGSVYEIGTPAYAENMPPAKCEGGDRCRGLYIVATEGLA